MDSVYELLKYFIELMGCPTINAKYIIIIKKWQQDRIQHLKACKLCEQCVCYESALEKRFILGQFM